MTSNLRAVAGAGVGAAAGCVGADPAFVVAVGSSVVFLSVTSSFFPFFPFSKPFNFSLMELSAFGLRIQDNC